MNYTEHMQELSRSWLAAQKKIADQWAAASRPAQAAAWDPETWIKQWRQSARGMAETWLRDAKGVPKEVGEKVLEGSDTYLRFMDFFFDAMKEISPKIEAGADWSKAFRQYIEGLGSLSQPAWNPGAAAGDVGELWKLYMAQLKVVSQPWVESFGEARGHVGDVMAGDRRAAIRMFNLFTDTYEQTLGKFLSAPAMGYTREYQEKVTKAFEAWVDARRAEAAFQGELFNVGLKALEALADALREKSEKGEKITSPKALFNTWVEIAEGVYFRAASSESFAQAQGRYVNAAMHYRVHERVLFEQTYKACYLPTRTEIDDAYKHFYDLRKEVKDLRTELKAVRRDLDSARKELVATETAPAAPVAATARARKAASPAGSKPAVSAAPSEGKE